MEITKDILYVGVNDREIDLFEGQYIVPSGMAYNSYLLIDEKTAVLDTVDARFSARWLDGIANALGEKEPDYLVVHHMEPDHSGSIDAFLNRYKNATVVSSAKAFAMMGQFFGNDYGDRRIVVGEGDTLPLGEMELTFVTAPMVHWPEVIVSFEKKTGTLFSADAFGKFGALDADEDWACEARRYYFGIVGKYGMQAAALLKKAAALPVQRICPLHGPVLDENLEYYIGKYAIWSAYESEDAGVTIAYTSVYGNTKKAALRLADILTERGVTVSVHDLARTDMAEAVEDAFRYDRLVLATTTYNAGIFPHMHTFMQHLTERNFQNKTVGFIENGSWAPTATKEMRKLLEGSKNLTFLEEGVHIRSALSQENEAELTALADALCK